MHTLSIILVMFIFLGCRNNKYEIQLPKKLTGKLNITNQNYTALNEVLNYSFEDSVSHNLIKIESSIENNKLYSVLSFKQNDNWVIVNNFNLNLSGDYKKNVNVLVGIKAEELLNQLDLNTIESISNMLQHLPKILANKLGKKDYFKESALSMFYHWGVFSAAKRAVLAKLKVCNCTLNTSYVNNGSRFFCAEDKLVSADEAYKFIKKASERKTNFGKNINPLKLLAYLHSESGKAIPVSVIDEIFSAEVSYFWRSELTDEERLKVLLEITKKNGSSSKQISDFPEGEEPEGLRCWAMNVYLGTDCGCCGNYSGPCLFCTYACYIHDFMCIACIPWEYCLPGCIVGGC